MATSITRDTRVKGRTVIVEFTLVAKDSSDDVLYRKFGDIMLNVSGYFGDPNDLSFPKYWVEAGLPLGLFTSEKIVSHFEDATLTIEALQKRAKLWADNVQLQIQNGILSLRQANDTVSQTSTISI